MDLSGAARTWLVTAGMNLVCQTGISGEKVKIVIGIVTKSGGKILQFVLTVVELRQAFEIFLMIPALAIIIVVKLGSNNVLLNCFNLDILNSCYQFKSKSVTSIIIIVISKTCLNFTAVCSYKLSGILPPDFC